MHHIAIAQATIAQNAYGELTAIQDQIINIESNRFRPSEDMGLAGAFACGATIARVRLNTPSSRMITDKFINPLTIGTLPADNPKMEDLRANPWLIGAFEELSVEGYQTSAGTEKETAVFVLTSGRRPMPAGNVYTMRGTGTTTLVADAWTTVPVTWQNTLPPGLFAVVGGLVAGVSPIAFRLILPNQQLRPGGLALAAETSRTHDMFKCGGLGVWGTFRNTDMPRLEVFARAADTAQTLLLDIMRIAP